MSLLNSEHELSTEMVRRVWEMFWLGTDEHGAPEMMNAFDVWLADRTLENDTQIALAQRQVQEEGSDGWVEICDRVYRYLAANPVVCLDAQRILVESGKPGILSCLAQNPNLHSSVLVTLIDTAFTWITAGDGTDRKNGEEILYWVAQDQPLKDEQQVRLARYGTLSVRRSMAWPRLRRETTLHLCKEARDLLANDRSSRIRRLVADYWDEEGYPLPEE